MPKALAADNRQFTFAVSAALAPSDASTKQRKFSGVAYSGEVIPGHWYWGDVIFDVSTITFPAAKLAMLIDHDPAKRAGFADTFSLDGIKLMVGGALLSNDAGASVAQDSDEGFPWQMSVHINPGSVEEVLPGNSVIVNGQSLNGPITVFRNSNLSEVSFTAVGWDANTSAAAMSRGGSPKPISKEENNMDLKELQDRVAALEAEKTSLTASNASLVTERDAALAQAAKFSADARTTDIKSLFTALNREYKADDVEVKTFSAMTQEAFDATASLLKAAVAKADPKLFSHQSTAGTAPAAGAQENPLLADAKQRAAQFSKKG